MIIDGMTVSVQTDRRGAYIILCDLDGISVDISLEREPSEQDMIKGAKVARMLIDKYTS